MSKGQNPSHYLGTSRQQAGDSLGDGAGAVKERVGVSRLFKCVSFPEPLHSPWAVLQDSFASLVLLLPLPPLPVNLPLRSLFSFPLTLSTILPQRPDSAGEVCAGKFTLSD